MPDDLAILCLQNEHPRCTSQQAGPIPNSQTTTIQKLPFEILRHIFLLALTLTYPTISPSGPAPTRRRRYRIAPSLSKDPLSFTYVCSWWRAVALAVPELWTAVSGTQDWKLNTTYGVLCAWMNNFTLSSSPPQSSAIDFHLAHTLPTPPDAREARRMIQVLRLFWDHMGNIRSLNLRLENELLYEFKTLASKPVSATLLEEVDFTFVMSAGNRVYEINRVISWLSKLPNLRRLRWIYLPTGQSYQGIKIDKLPWSTLEEVLMQFPMSLQTKVGCISRCTSAKTISLTTLGWYEDEGDVSPTGIDMSITTLPALTSLTLYEADATKLLINYLTLPALKHLNIKTQPTNRPGLATIDLKDFLARSKCALQKLILRQPNEWQPDPREFYTLPGIANLRVLDLFYHKSKQNLQEFLAEGGRDCLAQLGIKRVMIWGGKGGGQHSPGWEEHIGWKDRFGKDELLSEVYQCV